MAEYLGTGTGQPPPEYVRYRLRMMYHCTPAELDAQRGMNVFEMMRDLSCLYWENKAAETKGALR